MLANTKDLKKLEDIQSSVKDRIDNLATKILKDNLKAFKELVKPKA